MDWKDALRQAAGEANVWFDEPMRRHTTFAVGGPADGFVIADSEKHLMGILNACHEYALPYYIIGNGSNLLVGDKGYRGVIVTLGGSFTEIVINGCEVKAGSAVIMGKLARVLCENGLSGMEFGAGIPGTLGGAMVMNAGAYGGEMADIVTGAVLMNDRGQIIRADAAALDMGYRRSIVQSRGDIVLWVELLLKKCSPADIQECIEALAVKRREKQPLEYHCAGSTFKRPEGYFAGKLIQEAGLAGLRIGGACVSEKHCGFVINDKNASAQDIKSLCELIQQTVYRKYNVTLETEVKIIGDF